MKRIWLWIKKWWWVALAGIIFVFAYILRGTRKYSPEETGTFDSLLEGAKSKKDLAEDQILIEKAKRDTTVEEDRKALDRIAQEPDRAKRREQMASWLTDNL